MQYNQHTEHGTVTLLLWNYILPASYQCFYRLRGQVVCTVDYVRLKSNTQPSAWQTLHRLCYLHLEYILLCC